MDTFDLTGTELAGFRLDRRLGSGGMATVYRAVNTLQPSIVRALKVIHPTLAVDPEFIQRFGEEARNLERLTHPNVVRFHGIRQEGAHFMMELELLEGRSLQEVLEALPAGQGVPAEDAARWMFDAASGVAAAHALSVVHRDLKPENLFLTDSGVKVLDFGIAKARDEAERATRLTQVGTTVGTAGYLAPEAWEAGEAGPAADVYALGLTLAELLLGHHPFMPPDAPRPSRVQLMNAHINKGVPDLRQSGADIPAWLGAIVACATAQKPEDRYPTATEFARALEQGMAGDAPDTVAPSKPKSMTELALPTVPKAGEVPPPGDAPKGRGATGPMGALGCVAAVVVVGLIGAVGMGLGAWVYGPSTDGVEPDVAATPTVDNLWMAVAVPEKPVALGLPSQEGVGFWPEAGIRTPPAAYQLQQHEVSWGELDPWLGANPGAAFERPAAVPADPAERARLAASGVPWEVADAYCRGLADDASLPTEEQWEFAARGEALRPYAWGDRPPDPLRTNAFGGEDWAVAEVMASSQDRTPGPKKAAFYDLMGNVREWTADPYRVATTGVTPPAAASAEQTMRTLRGLPLKPHPRGEIYERARYGAAWRKPLCGTGKCLQEPTLEGESVTEALREVGFRCAREVEEAKG